MGYRSDVRVILKKEDYEELVKKMNEFYERRDYKCRMFDEDEVIVFSQNEKWVKFGWDFVKWYESYEDINMIMNFITNCEQYHYMRLGEEIGDLDIRDTIIDYDEYFPGTSSVIQSFDD